MLLCWVSWENFLFAVTQKMLGKIFFFLKFLLENVEFCFYVFSLLQFLDLWKFYFNYLKFSF